MNRGAYVCIEKSTLVWTGVVRCICNEVYAYTAAALAPLQTVHQTQIKFKTASSLKLTALLPVNVYSTWQYNMILTYMHHLMKVYLVAQASIVVQFGANERNIVISIIII